MVLYLNMFITYLRPLFLSLLLFSSCTSPHKSTPKQILNLNIPSDPATLDPRKGGDAISATFHFLLYDGLMRGNPDGSLSFALAESYELSCDRKTYLFHLKEAYFSNGERITAQEFEESWKAILTPSFPAPNAHLLYPIKNGEAAKRGALPLSEVGVKALDPQTLEVHLEQPTPYFLELVSFSTFFPVCKEVREAEAAPLICSGPFILKSWKHDNEIVLAKNENYHRKDEVRLSEIRYFMVKNEMTAFQMFEKGEIDILGQPILPLPADSLPDLIRKNRVQTRPMAATTFCTFNVTKFPFHNINIRKAFALSINREEIVKNITLLGEKAALEMVPSVLKKNQIHHLFKDADMEKALLYFQKGCEELHLAKDHFPEIVYYYSTSELNSKIAQAIQQQWQKHLGVKIKLENLDHKILIQKLSKRDFTFAQTYWMAQYNDPMNILERFKFKENVKNYSHWENESYKQLLNASLHSKTEKERFELMQKAEELFIEEMPLAPIFHWNCSFIAKDYVKSFDLAPLGNGFFERVYIDRKENNL